MKLSFDLDGTIAEGKYVVAPERGPQAYLGLLPYDCHTRCVWNRLCQNHEVYIITSRSYPGAAKDASLWLTEQELAQPCGIITMGNRTVHADKAKLVVPLGIVAHFDDAPQTVKACYDKCRSYLMNNPEWIDNQEFEFRGIPRVTSWLQIEDIIARIYS